MLAQDSWLDEQEKALPPTSRKSQMEYLKKMQQTIPVFATRKEGESVNYEIELSRMTDKYGDWFVAVVD